MAFPLLPSLKTDSKVAIPKKWRMDNKCTKYLIRISRGLKGGC